MRIGPGVKTKVVITDPTEMKAITEAKIFPVSVFSDSGALARREHAREIHDLDVVHPLQFVEANGPDYHDEGYAGNGVDDPPQDCTARHLSTSCGATPQVSDR